MTSLKYDTGGLKDLIESLLQDPFTKEQNLQVLSLEEIGSFFESQEDENHTDKKGFERTKSLYCLILMELELLGYTEPPAGEIKGFYDSLNTNNSGEIELFSGLQPAPLKEVATGFDDLVLPGGEKLENSVTREATPKADPRVDALSKIWAVETTLYSKLRSTLSSFWLQRDAYISRVIYQNGHAFDFHPALREGLELLEKRHPEWMYEGKFPVAGIMSSLRYILSASSIEKFVPACIDFATFFLLFGRNAEYGPQLIYNVLGLKGLSNQESVELASRLCRLQRAKAKVLNPHCPLSELTLKIINEDVPVIHAFASKSECAPPKNETKKVA